MLRLGLAAILGLLVFGKEISFAEGTTAAAPKVLIEEKPRVIEQEMPLGDFYLPGRPKDFRFDLLDRTAYC